MTPETGFAPEPSNVLEDLYVGPSRADGRGIPAVTFRSAPRHGRTRAAARLRMPWATIAWVLLLIASAIAAVTLLIGSPARVPPPFGPARDGRIAWAFDGDIVVGDPASGVSRILIGTDDIDRNPVFSRDGTRLAFFRQVPSETGRFDLVVTTADGGDPAVLTPVPITMPLAVAWAPDAASLLVNDDAGRLDRYFVDGSAPRRILDGVHLEPDAVRPPHGDELLYEREGDPGALYVMSADGSDPRQVFGPATTACACALAGPAGWSPDGAMVAFPTTADGGGVRMQVMRADGSGLRPLTDEDGTWRERDPVWSPDGSRIAFNRWQLDDAGAWHVRSIALAPMGGGAVTPIGVAPASEGALIDWSPDGSTVLSLPRTLIDAFTRSLNADGSVARPTLIDPASGTARQFDWSIGSSATWQRLAR